MNRIPSWMVSILTVIGFWAIAWAGSNFVMGFHPAFGFVWMVVIAVAVVVFTKEDEAGPFVGFVNRVLLKLVWWFIIVGVMAFAAFGITPFDTFVVFQAIFVCDDRGFFEVLTSSCGDAVLRETLNGRGLLGNIKDHL